MQTKHTLIHTNKCINFTQAYWVLADLFPPSLPPPCSVHLNSVSRRLMNVLYFLEMVLSLLLCSLTSPLFRYTQNGILHMLDRNKRIKSKPERFQSCKDKFDLVITCEERVYDQVLEGEASHEKCLITEGIKLVIQTHIITFLLIVDPSFYHY